MNYIRHLTGFFDRVCKDHRLNPTHISVYMAIFQFWNVNRFKNPLSISRSEIMELSKVSSRNTYHKCMKELHQYGYFRYDPSYHPLRGSWVYLLVFDPSAESDQHKKGTSDGQALDMPETGVGQAEDKLTSETLADSALQSSLNISKLIKYTKPISSAKKRNELENENKGEERSEKKKELPPAEKKIGACQIAPTNNDLPVATEIKHPELQKLSESIPRDVETAVQFFLSSGYPQAQAVKFFYYYSTTGWKLAGKTPIENWQSAAHSWMLHAHNTHTNVTNQRNQKSEPRSNQLHATADKNYSEPL